VGGGGFNKEVGENGEASLGLDNSLNGSYAAKQIIARNPDVHKLLSSARVTYLYLVFLV
jgi:hypothetical protein